MVQVICEKTGIEFEAATRRTKNHPTIMSWLEKSNRYDWYSQALETLTSGRKQGYTTIEQYNALFEETEKSAQEENIARFKVKRDEEEAAKAVRRERHITNSILREHGYRWSDLGFPEDEEIDNSYLGPTPRHDWQLFSSDDRAVSTQQAMQEIFATSQSNYAKEWLEQRNMPLVADPPADTYEWDDNDPPERHLEYQTYHHAHAWSDIRWLMDYPNLFKTISEVQADAEAKWIEWTNTDIFKSYAPVSEPDLEKLHALFVSNYRDHYAERDIPARQEQRS
jgi:hypothetical protein